MKHLNSDASLKDKQALATAIANANLAQKVLDVKQYNSSFSFENGDVLTIESGYASPHTFTDANGNETEFLAFDATVKRGNRTFDIVVSVRQLTSPSFSTKEPEGVIKRSDLLYRYGRQILDFEDIEMPDKTTSTLAKLPNRISGKIVIAEKAYMPSFSANYDRENKSWDGFDTRDHYGYLK